MSRQVLTYEGWMRKVDEWVYELAGCSVHDLPDCGFAAWYVGDMRPKTAARKAIKNAKTG